MTLITLLLFVVILSCPLGMGVMMWFEKRGARGVRAGEEQAPLSPRPGSSNWNGTRKRGVRSDGHSARATTTSHPKTGKAPANLIF